MSKYAKTTKVPVMQSVGEIQKTVERYGATSFQYVVAENRAGIAFQTSDPPRMVKVQVSLPDDPQQVRQRWRALLLVVKSKLESVESGIETFDEAWMPHIVVESTGETLGRMMLPDLGMRLATGKMPNLLEG